MSVIEVVAISAIVSLFSVSATLAIASKLLERHITKDRKKNEDL